MKLVTTKTVEKLLQSLNNDPRLQVLDDATILSEEQYPVAFDALIMRSRLVKISTPINVCFRFVFLLI
jgi:hypothetical protein